jgi:hypothetical protein
MPDNLELWKQRIAEWKAGTQPRRDFCKTHDLNLSTFDYWQRRIKKIDQPEQPLVRVANPITAVNAEPIILQTDGGYRLEIPSRFCAESLKTILKCLRSPG